MKALLLTALAAWSLGSPSMLDTGPGWSPFANRAAGHELRLPPGWNAYVSHGSTVVSSRPLRDPTVSPADVRLRPGDVYLRIDETSQQVYAGNERPRPGRFERLPPPTGHDCGFGEGSALLFREGGRHFFAFVRVGPQTGGRDALAVLNTLRVTQ